MVDLESVERKVNICIVTEACSATAHMPNSSKRSSELGGTLSWINYFKWTAEAHPECPRKLSKMAAWAHK